MNPGQSTVSTEGAREKNVIGSRGKRKISFILTQQCTTIRLFMLLSPTMVAGMGCGFLYGLQQSSLYELTFEVELGMYLHIHISTRSSS